MNNNIQCELVSWNHFYQLCRDLAFQIKNSNFNPDIIIAIGRGGYMPARILSDYLDNMNLTSFKVEHYKGSHKEPIAKIRYPLCAEIAHQQVLLIDDVSDTGDTFKVAIDHILEHAHPTEIKTASLHHKIASSYLPDYYAEKIINWRWIIYPWAVIEDISKFIKGMSPLPDTIEEINKKLARENSIEAPQQIISDILRLLEANES